MSTTTTTSAEITPAEPETITTKHPSSGSNGSVSTPQNSNQTQTVKDLPAPNQEPAKNNSRWTFFRDFFAPKTKKSQPKSLIITSNNTTHNSADQSTAAVDEKVVLSNLISVDIEYVKEASERLEKYKTQMELQEKQVRERFQELRDKGGDEKDFKELKKEVIKLKLQIPSKYVDEKDLHNKSQHSGGMSKTKLNIPEKVLEKLPLLHSANHITAFEKTQEFLDVEALFNKLEIEPKLCLLCFSIFPENAIIKKRLLVYWWIAERFLPPIARDDKTKEEIKNGKTAEDFATEYFEKFTELGFIEPVIKKRGLSVGCYRMHPFKRSVLIVLAKRAKFFNFDEKGEPTEDFTGCLRACLVGNSLEDIQDTQTGEKIVQELEKVHLVFNVREPLLEFKAESFSKMRNVNVLYLGRWKVSPVDHIEVEDTNFLDGLKEMNHLRFFSLQGVSRITELPESITMLSNLVILDLRACHNLESIPEKIGLLKNLTHLDMSECYLLDLMPKSLSQLRELRVLKGFVVGNEQGKNGCTLDDLKKLPKLIKLCIYTGLAEFPTDDDVRSLAQLEKLQKLTIAWGGGASYVKATNKFQNPKSDGGEQKQVTPRPKEVKKPEIRQFKRSLAFHNRDPKLPPELEKLDLKCFPKAATPEWLMPSKLKGLKKLYIRGGKFSDLGQYQDLDDKLDQSKWDVEILRLKYLTELEMDWRELRQLFPKLTYLDKVCCPKLTFFPCDGKGVWIEKRKKNELAEMVP